MICAPELVCCPACFGEQTIQVTDEFMDLIRDPSPLPVRTRNLLKGFLRVVFEAKRYDAFRRVWFIPCGLCVSTGCVLAELSSAYIFMHTMRSFVFEVIMDLMGILPELFQNGYSRLYENYMLHSLGGVS